MNNSIDLYLTPFARVGGKEIPGLYSLYVSDATKQAIRSRKVDRLVLYLVMTGDVLLRQDQQNQLLKYLADYYFKKSGSATAAMRAVAEELNKILLEINLRYAKKGQQGIGLLTLMVFREQQVYLTISGPKQAFHVSGTNVQHIFDPALVGRGLGQGSVTPMSYYQLDVKAGDGILLGAKPPSSLSSDSILDFSKTSPEDLEQLLPVHLEPDLNGVFVHAMPGKGNCFITARKEKDWDAIPASPSSEEKSGDPETIALAAAAGIKSQKEAGEVIDEQAHETETPPAGDSSEEEPGAVIEIPPVESSTSHEAEEQAEIGLVQDNEKAITEEEHTIPAWNRIGAIGIGLIGYLSRIFGGLKMQSQKVLPSAGYFDLPSGTMAFFALFIPVVIVGIASVSYFKLGRAAQYDTLFSQAQEMASNASIQDDLDKKRSEWISLLEFLDQVEMVDATDETGALRVTAINALDTLDLVNRIDYEPAIIGGLPESVMIADVVLIDNDIYMLDGSSGSVLHAQLTSQGYKPDPSFQCSPNFQEEQLTGPIIDIERWPKGLLPDAALMAMDAQGNVLFCNPDNSPQPAMFAPPNLSPFEYITAITISQGDVYVLDPTTNGVWIYWNGDLGNEPELFFDIEIPQLDDVIDLTVNNNELYLLHRDGSMTLCRYSGIGVAPTRCTRPSYVDFRQGHENEIMDIDGAFDQVVFNPPPDPSLYILEPSTQSIFHFSMRNLVYQKQFKPELYSITGEATAFTFDPIKRNFFLAAGDELFYGVMP